VRVGPIYLDMSEEELKRVGSPDAIEPQPLSIYNKMDPAHAVTYVPAILYRYGLLWVYVERSTRRVASIDLGNKGNCLGFHTKESISCGSDIYNLIGAYGEPDVRRGDDFSNKLSHVTYISKLADKQSITVFKFHRGGTMADRPENSVQSIELISEKFAGWYKAGN
jgi:hypothetical protein